MNVSVKQAKSSDWQELRFIRLKALQSDPSVFGSNYEKESGMTEADWRSWLETDDGATFLIYENTTLIGMTRIGVNRDDPTKKTAFLWGSWLEPSARGKGLSQIMYEKRIEWAKRHPTIEQIGMAALQRGQYFVWQGDSLGMHDTLLKQLRLRGVPGAEFGGSQV